MSRKVILILIVIFSVSSAFAQLDLVWGAINGMTTLTKPAGTTKIDTSTRISGRCLMQATLSNSLCQKIQLKLVDGNRTVIQTTWTDAAGFFEFYDVPKGEYSIDPGFSNFKIESNGKIQPGGKVAMQVTE